MAPTFGGDVLALHLTKLLARAQDPNNPPLCSVFALVIDRAHSLSGNSISSTSNTITSRSFGASSSPPAEFHVLKRQQQMLVIPTTYASLNSSPAPGAVVGITLGAVLGFLLALFLFLFSFRAVYGGGGVIVEEEIIRRRRGSRSKHSRTASSISEVAAPPPVFESRRASRISRRESRRTDRPSRTGHETVVVEEELSVASDPPAVVVEEEEDDIVEVIEEHSPEPPRRKRKSGFRTVDPTQYGGGDAPSRRISRASRRE